MDLYEFKASLVYRVSSRTARAPHRNSVSKKSKIKQMKETTRLTKTNNENKIHFLVSSFIGGVSLSPAASCSGRNITTITSKLSEILRATFTPHTFHSLNLEYHPPPPSDVPYRTCAPCDDSSHFKSNLDSAFSSVQQEGLWNGLQKAMC